MKTKFKVAYVLCLTCLAGACRDPFVPVLPRNALNLLVVEGLINTGSGSTHITLSRTTDFADSASLKPETGATVNVESESHSLTLLTDSGGGQYFSSALTINHGERYRLHISCKSGEEYVSDFQFPLTTPLVDSLTWHEDASGIHIFINTHDPAGKMNYYRFSFEETWEIRSAYKSFYKYVDSQVVDRNLNEIPMLYSCWKYNNSTSILQASSAGLRKAEIYHFPIQSFYKGDERVGIRYSILVKQVAQTVSGYKFYKLLKANTEGTGSIFSMQPSQLAGNVHAIKGNKDAIGYIDIGDGQESRLNIYPVDVPDWDLPHNYCTTKIITPDSQKYFFPYYIPLSRQTGTLNYISSDAGCVDCRLRGSPIRPSYW